MKINEIFTSIQGEGLRTGLPCTFIRLAGCNLRCAGWPCDTPYAQHNADGHSYSIARLIEEVPSWPPYITWTGGEPLLQEDKLLEAIRRFEKLHFAQDLFTNGSRRIPQELLHKAIMIVMDYKLPSSGEYGQMIETNLKQLRHQDVIKGVISTQEDFDIFITDTQDLRCNRIVTPAWGKIEPVQLVQMIQEKAADIRLGLQIHKYIWEPNLRGV